MISMGWEEKENKRKINWRGSGGDDGREVRISSPSSFHFLIPLFNSLSHISKSTDGHLDIVAHSPF